MKILLILILGSLSVAAGGVAMLFLNGSNITDIEMWTFAFMSVVKIPFTMVEHAIDGEQKEFFRGVLVAVGGVVLAAMFSLIAVTASALGTMRPSSRRVSKEPAGWAVGGPSPRRKSRTASPEKSASPRRPARTRVRRKPARSERNSRMPWLS